MIEIKKYSNRRLYNTETSAYITLDDIVTLIKKELDFKVVDVDTQTDITSTILTQIILEKETGISFKSVWATLKECKESLKKEVGEEYQDYLNQDYELIK